MSPPRRRSPVILFLTALFMVSTTLVPAQTAKTSPVTIAGSQFMRDGKPYQIISGSIHYPRVPREYWRDRLRKARAMGLNTVETYVFWNLHEPKPGVFNFSGNNDVAAFVRMAQEEGLNVIVRPGPYVCGEWETGGLPAWLFADNSIKVRTQDPRFLAASDRYLARVRPELAPLQATRGGPIIAVQVENEYGTFGNDQQYMERFASRWSVRIGRLYSLYLRRPKTPGQRFAAGSSAVTGFGAGRAVRSYVAVSRIHVYGVYDAICFNQPWMTGEYWAGWYDAWGGEHAHTDADLQAEEVDWMLARVFTDCTCFMVEPLGFMNGANVTGNTFPWSRATITMPRWTRRANRREVLSIPGCHSAADGHHATSLACAVANSGVCGFPAHGVGSAVEQPAGRGEHGTPRSMETFGQIGYILYRTKLTGPAAGELVIDDVRDYAAIYLTRSCKTWTGD